MYGTYEYPITCEFIGEQKPLTPAHSTSTGSLTSLTAYNHLRNLETLDISNNGIESFARVFFNYSIFGVCLNLWFETELQCLHLLRDLRADGNSVSTVEGIEHLSGLVKLSLKKNKISQINLKACTW